MQVPRLLKIVINMCVSDAVQDSKKLQTAVDDLAIITGQKPIITKAKNSIASFKLREGMSIGTNTTRLSTRASAFPSAPISVILTFSNKGSSFFLPTFLTFHLLK